MARQLDLDQLRCSDHQQVVVGLLREQFLRASWELACEECLDEFEALSVDSDSYVYVRFRVDRDLRDAEHDPSALKFDDGVADNHGP